MKPASIQVRFSQGGRGAASTRAQRCVPVCVTYEGLFAAYEQALNPQLSSLSYRVENELSI